MHEPSDGIAEEVERQLQLALATAADRRAAGDRRAPARDRAGQRARANRPPGPPQARIDAERCSRPSACGRCSTPRWWETAGPQDDRGHVAGGQQLARP